ncbi:MAG TPA: DUF924 family protein [Polyangiaceae bacterium]|nr:DUF924 family protein [Polyangiaceae bacterium]
MGNTRAQAILSEWFGDLDSGGMSSTATQKRWWTKDPAFDDHLRALFEADVQAAMLGEMDSWLEEPSTTLALILLLDQITRNIYRDLPEMYFGDARALKAVDKLLSTGGDLQLPVQQRVFAYMPLMHAESNHRQQQSVAQFKKLLDEASDLTRQTLSNYYSFAQKHAEIIARFGRFPHRNAVLERTSTGDEVAFLQEPGSSF